MAIISSLVGIESDAVEAPEAKSSLATLGARVSALASLYDILYDSGGIEDIDLVDYLGRVTDSAAESMGADARGISVTKDLAPASIDMKRAISIGLIVNELVTDCFKHAFPVGRRGTVAVRLAREGDTLALDIRDDGVGLPPGFDPAEAEGFGLKLVGLLAEQLGSSFVAASSGGSRFSLRFPA
jgi:two-component sensor histidine kinase